LEFGGEDYDHCCHSNLIRALAEHGVSEPEKFGEKTQAIGWVGFALLCLVWFDLSVVCLGLGLFLVGFLSSFLVWVRRQVLYKLDILAQRNEKHL
jgi:hypothetical protein